MSTDTALDLVILTELDWHPPEPCEHPDHDKTHLADDAAAWRVMYICPGCGMVRLYLLCDSGKEIQSRPGVVYCDACNHFDTWGAFVILLERI